MLQEYSRRICEWVRQSPQFHQAERVAIFYPRDWEINLLPLWESRPEHCYFPRVDPATLVMRFFRVEKMSELVPGTWDIPAPPADPGRLAAIWTERDLVLCPGLLFDREGGRLGGGLGIYDRFLGGNAAEKWGICGNDQIMEEKVAVEDTDVRMNALCTETGILRVSP